MRALRCSILTGAAATIATCAALATPAAAAAIEIRTLSSRADTVTGGDALVEISLPPALRGRAPKVTVGGRDVSAAFEPAGEGRLVGLVGGLPEGAARIRVQIGRRAAATLRIANRAAGGPVFAGPQLQPWRCTTEEHALGRALDARCNAATPVVRHLYKHALTGSFEPYDAQHPPAESHVARTTTDAGRTVPYVVRVERGTVDRGIYAFAVLADAWNGKLYVPYGGSCAARYSQPAPAAIEVSQSAPDGAVLLDRRLGRGYAVATSGLNTLGQNCNLVVSAEALSILKEHIAETLGPIRYTIGEGCSGGSMQQHFTASAYPGLLDGLLPSCSFPDLWSPLAELADCMLLDAYFTRDGGALWLDPLARAAAAGHSTVATCSAFVVIFADVWNPAATDALLVPCDPPRDQVYDRERNRAGVRCSVQDYQANIWGLRPDGFANRALDNVGVQYGLRPLLQGRITPEQFVHLNEHVGGLDIDGRPAPARMEADAPALGRAFRAAHVITGANLDRVPIIDLRGTGNAEVHTDFWSYATRERLKAAHGTAGNQVIWTTATDGFASVGLNLPLSPREDAFSLMDRWLAGVEADSGERSLAEKVLANKPAAAVDACYLPGRTTDAAACRAAFPVYANPRIAAGGPLSSDVVKCRLKPLRRNDYPAGLTDGQWTRLRAVFPGGVCDYDAQSLGREPSLTWPTFAGGPGGEPLGEAPVSRPAYVRGAGGLGLPSARRCVDGSLRFRASRGLGLARFYRDSRLVRTLRGSALRRPLTIALRARATVVRIRATTRGGRLVTAARRYRACG